MLIVMGDIQTDCKQVQLIKAVILPTFEHSVRTVDENIENGYLSRKEIAKEEGLTGHFPV